jgi:hypothetical protein
VHHQGKEDDAVSDRAAAPDRELDHAAKGAGRKCHSPPLPGGRSSRGIFAGLDVSLEEIVIWIVDDAVTIGVT